MKSNPPHSPAVFSVSLWRAYSSLTSCSCSPACLAKAGAFPSSPTTPHECCGYAKRITGTPSPHVQSRELHAVHRSERPHWLQKLPSQWSKGSQKQLLDCPRAGECSLQHVQVAVADKEGLSHCSGMDTSPEQIQGLCSTSACSADHICATFHKEHTSSCAFTRVLSVLQIAVPCTGVFPGSATPWMLI